MRCAIERGMCTGVASERCRTLRYARAQVRGDGLRSGMHWRSTRGLIQKVFPFRSFPNLRVWDSSSLETLLAPFLKHRQAQRFHIIIAFGPHHLPTICFVRRWPSDTHSQLKANANTFLRPPSQPSKPAIPASPAGPSRPASHSSRVSSVSLASSKHVACLGTWRLSSGRISVPASCPESREARRRAASYQS